MKNGMKAITVICSLLVGLQLNAQVGGNQLYQKKSNNYNYNRAAVESRPIYSTDSTLVVTSKVLLNQSADSYVITIGVNSMAKTVVEANQNTNKKIENVRQKIKQLGITDDDIYVDFISETKMYDHTVAGGDITEYFDGFSIRKNLIIKTARLADIDKIVNYCSEQEIYDIVKVDYVSEDLEKINEELFDEALKVAKAKTKRFSAGSSVRLTNKHRIVSESFKVFYPKNLYKQYDEAFETSVVNTRYNSNYVKKEARKERTFYYEGIETEIGVDKIIDKISPKVGIQYVMELVVVYELAR